MWERFTQAPKTPQQDVDIDLKATPQQAIYEATVIDDANRGNGNIVWAPIREASNEIHKHREVVKLHLTTDRIAGVRTGFISSAKSLQEAGVLVDGKLIDPLKLVSDAVAGMVRGYQVDYDAKKLADHKEFYSAIKSGYLTASGIITAGTLALAEASPYLDQLIKDYNLTSILSQFGMTPLNTSGLTSGDIIAGVGTALVLATTALGVTESVAKGAANLMEERRLRQKITYMGRASKQIVGALLADLKAAQIVIPEAPKKKFQLPSVLRRNKSA